MNFDECVVSVAVESLSDPVSEIEDADGNPIQSESVSTCQTKWMANLPSYATVEATPKARRTSWIHSPVLNPTRFNLSFTTLSTHETVVIVKETYSAGTTSNIYC
jgi:hypothetical protein